MAKLTGKQRRFVDEYLVDLNATQAAMRAGYSERTASVIGAENLIKPNIQKAVKEALDAIHSAKIADAAEVMRYLTAVLRGETQSEIVVVENIGDYMSEARKVQKAPDEKERLRAAELIGKRYGIFTEKLNLEGALPVVISGGDDLED